MADDLGNLAQKLGLSLRPGIEALKASRGYKEEMASCGAIAGLAAQMLEQALATAFRGLLVGEYGGYEVDLYQIIHPSASPGGFPAVFTLYFPKPYDLGLVVCDETFWDKAKKTFRLTQDIEVGDPDLDDIALIKGRDVEAVRRLLSEPELQGRIADMFEYSKGFTIRDYGIRLQVNEMPRLDEDKVREVLDLMVGVADALPPG